MTLNAQLTQPVSINAVKIHVQKAIHVHTMQNVVFLIIDLCATVHQAGEETHNDYAINVRNK
jgi:hypothetical protein